MPQVAAGDKTGVYHIIVAGLPWQCTWQRLKDFARNVQPDGSCVEIDHAYVNPEYTTNGWVRVKGKDNFLKTLKHLDGGILDRRALMADGRNATEETQLSDAVPAEWKNEDSAPRTRRHRGSSAASGGRDVYSYSPSTYGTADAAANWYHPPPPPATTYPPTSPTYTTLPYHPAPSPSHGHPATTRIMYAGQMAPNTPVYIPSQQPVMTYTMTYDAPMSPTSVLHMTGSTHYAPTPAPIPSVPVIKTEARKIIVTQLPHSISTSDLRDLLANTITKASRTQAHSYTALQDIEIARHVDGTARGHAFATLETHGLAKACVKALDGMKFKNRTLQARFAKEGVDPAKSFEPAGLGLVSPPPPYRRTGKSGSNGGSKIGDGKTRSVKKRDSEGEKERERKERAEPLVVDGSTVRCR